ncbi:MAG: radical SAM protein, partial [Nitrospinae bacterium]|nr:radical SAM protein [Nitrospinota bacterium]
ASNGIAFTDLDFAYRAKEAGLDGIYLQFDGMVDAIYKKTRGESLFKKKLQAIENAGKAGLYVVLVCTVVRGVNNHQVGEILKFGIEHCDTVSGCAFQPVTFTGRIAQRMREKMRYTLSDLAHDIEDQTGLAEAREDWFPIPCTSPFAKLFDALKGDGTAVNFSCHSHCGQGTYLYIDKRGGATPITRFIDLSGFLRAIDALAGKVNQSSSPTLAIVKLLANLRRFWDASKAPDGLTFSHFLHLLKELVEGRPESGKRGKGDELFMACGMHFMDSYNYEVERVKRCIIHYSAPNGLIYPFCTYNSGPVYREKVEKKFAMSMDQWKTQGAVKYTENIDKITKDVRVAERKKAEAAEPVAKSGCCSTEPNGHGGSCGCGDSHGQGNGDGKKEALVHLLAEMK